MAFGAAHRGVTEPAHQLTDRCLIPAVLLAKDPDVRADYRCMVLRNLIDAAAPSGHHAPACQQTQYDRKAPERLTYRFAASIASALRVT